MTFFPSEANQIVCGHFHSGHVVPGHLSLCSKTVPVWFTNKLFLILFESCIFHRSFFFIMYLFIFTWQRGGAATFGN